MQKNAFGIKQAENEMPVAAICRKMGTHRATYFNWKKKYARLPLPEMKRLNRFLGETGR
jgi:putative transposase